MEIYDLKINGISEPLGFELPWVNVSWKVRNTGSRRGAKACLLAAADPAFRQILYKKDVEGKHDRDCEEMVFIGGERWQCEGAE